MAFRLCDIRYQQHVGQRVPTGSAANRSAGTTRRRQLDLERSVRQSHLGRLFLSLSSPRFVPYIVLRDYCSTEGNQERSE